jgi:hypothetical protein
VRRSLPGTQSGGIPVAAATHSPGLMAAPTAARRGPPVPEAWALTGGPSPAACVESTAGGAGQQGPLRAGLPAGTTPPRSGSIATGRRSGPHGQAPELRVLAKLLEAGLRDRVGHDGYGHLVAIPVSVRAARASALARPTSGSRGSSGRVSRQSRSRRILGFSIRMRFICQLLGRSPCVEPQSARTPVLFVWLVPRRYERTSRGSSPEGVHAGWNLPQPAPGTSVPPGRRLARGCRPGIGLPG